LRSRRRFWIERGAGQQPGLQGESLAPLLAEHLVARSTVRYAWLRLSLRYAKILP
jgi:hypothetical protein